MSTHTELGKLDFRHGIRKFRNLLTVIVMVAVFAQVFGLPRIQVEHGNPGVRLVALEQPVWSHAYGALTLVWAWLREELVP